MPVVRKMVEVEGLSETLDALQELPKATARNVLKRLLVAAATPMAQTMEALAPPARGSLTKRQRRHERLRSTISVSTKLSKRQRVVHRNWVASMPEITDKQGRASNAKGGVFIFVGPAPLHESTLQEFGSRRHRPQPFARPAWDIHQTAMLDSIARGLWGEIEKARARLARKAERIAAKIRSSS